MKTTNIFLLPVLLVGLMLGACDGGPQQVDHAGAASDEGPLNRNLAPAQVTHGRAVYDTHCAVCHGAAGEGLPGDWRIRDAQGRFPPPPLDDSAHAWHHPTAVLLEMVREGSPQGQGNMPAWQGKLSEQEMQNVVAYIKSLWSDPVYRLWLKIEQQSLTP